MPLSVENVLYYSQTEVAEELGIRRETLWRWRNEGKIPRGRRFRGREVLFTEGEFEEAKAYANRLEPIESVDPSQLRLFGTSGGRP